MIWRRSTRKRPSQAAQDSIASTARELEEAKALRVEATEVGRLLHHSQVKNHFGLGLERAMRGRI